MDIGQLIQQHYSAALACLIKRLSDIEKAEDALQEASIAALAQWPKALPKSPLAWLIRVAYNASIDQFRKTNKLTPQSTMELTEQAQSITQVDYELDDAILRLMFVCCHPAISQENQLAITLKLVLGFQQQDIARALLIPEKTLEQRITRTKRKIKLKNIDFSLPAPNKLSARLPAVLRILYLIFNEGYHATSGEKVLCNQLCQHAITLLRTVCRNFRGQASCTALLSLMLFTHARVNARSENKIITLEQQDRRLWDKNAINQADILLQKSLKLGEVCHYHIEAAISGLHCQADSFETTDWQQICLLYEKLLTYHYTPVIQINRAVAYMMVENWPKAEDILMSIEHSVANYPPYHAALAKLYQHTQRQHKALSSLDTAMQLSKNHAEIAYFSQCQNDIKNG